MLKLEVTIVGAEDLVGVHVGGFANPFVAISGGAGIQRTSFKIKVSGCAKWDETFTIEFPTSIRSAALSLSVWDKSSDGDFFLGYVHHEPPLLVDGSMKTVSLKPRPGRDDTVQGKLMYKISYAPNGAPKPAASASDSQAKRVAHLIQQVTDAGRQHLDLSGCDISEIPLEMMTNPTWSILDLGFNSLRAVPLLLTCFQYLTHLYLYDNGITEIPSSIGESRSLRALYLDANYISQIPDVVSTLSSLVLLSLADNQIQIFALDLRPMRALRRLLLQGNPITSFQPTIDGAVALEVVNLSRCQLLEIPETVLAIPTLTSLSLARNRIRDLPHRLGERRLSRLDLSYNLISRLPDELSRNLPKTLLIHHNPLPPDLLELCKRPGALREHLIQQHQKRRLGAPSEAAAAAPSSQGLGSVASHESLMAAARTQGLCVIENFEEMNPYDLLKQRQRWIPYFCSVLAYPDDQLLAIVTNSLLLKKKNENKAVEMATIKGFSPLADQNEQDPIINTRLKFSVIIKFTKFLFADIKRWGFITAKLEELRPVTKIFQDIFARRTLPLPPLQPICLLAADSELRRARKEFGYLLRQYDSVFHILEARILMTFTNSLPRPGEASEPEKTLAVTKRDKALAKAFIREILYAAEVALREDIREVA